MEISDFRTNIHTHGDHSETDPSREVNKKHPVSQTHRFKVQSQSVILPVGLETAQTTTHHSLDVGMPDWREPGQSAIFALKKNCVVRQNCTDTDINRFVLINHVKYLVFIIISPLF